MRRSLARNVCLSALIACGGQVDETGGGDATNGDSSTVQDAESEASADVVLPDGFDPANCYSQSISTPCDDPGWALCEKWTRDRAYGAYGHTVCQVEWCTLGDYCPDGGPCQCSPLLQCAPGEVCYSDTPDGATHCKPACTPSP